MLSEAKEDSIVGMMDRAISLRREVSPFAPGLNQNIRLPVIF